MSNPGPIIGGGKFEVPLLAPNQELLDTVTRRRVTDVITFIQQREPGVQRAEWQGQHLVVSVKTGFNPHVVERRVCRRLFDQGLLQDEAHHSHARAS